MYAKTYVFGNKNQKLNTDSRSKETAVTGGQLYDVGLGYGFVTEADFRSNEMLQMPELSSGFVPAYADTIGEVTRIVTDDLGCHVDGRYAACRLGIQERCMIPLCFRADVERSGNYQITLEYQSEAEAMIFAGPRRLVCRSAGKEQKQSLTFVMNACDIIPMGRNCIYERKSIDITLIGENANLCRINIKQVNCPTIYIAGDSTVNDQPALYPYRSEVAFAGWGQMLPAYLNGKIAVSNHAHSGQTVETFRAEGHYAIIQAHIRFGDYLMIQFAHNDQKLANLRAKEGYMEALCRYIEETLAIGAYPILVTPVCRNTWRVSGVYADFLGEYAQACKLAAARYQIPVIDLHGASKDFIIQHGPEQTARYYYPKDFTHPNDYGAYLLAGMAVKEYCGQMRTGNYAEAYSRLASLMTRHGEWEPREVSIHLDNITSGTVWYEQDKEAAGQIRSVEELESMIKM